MGLRAVMTAGDLTLSGELLDISGGGCRLGVALALLTAEEKQAVTVGATGTVVLPAEARTLHCAVEIMHVSTNQPNGLPNLHLRFRWLPPLTRQHLRSWLDTLARRDFFSRRGTAEDLSVRRA